MNFSAIFRLTRTVIQAIMKSLGGQITRTEISSKLIDLGGILRITRQIIQTKMKSQGRTDVDWSKGSWFGYRQIIQTIKQSQGVTRDD